MYITVINGPGTHPVGTNAESEPSKTGSIK
jgi:hypothetical protein